MNVINVWAELRHSDSLTVSFFPSFNLVISLTVVGSTLQVDFNFYFKYMFPNLE